MKRLFSVLALALLIPTAALADDGGSWTSAQVNIGWQKSYAFARIEYRSKNNFSDTDATFLATGAGLKFTKWLKADLSYEYWQVNPEITMHKAVLTSTATLTRDALSVSVREKLEYAINPAASSTSLTLRSRLRAQYSLGTFTPYAMAEVFNWSSWVRSLYYAGTEVKIGKHNVLDFFYLYHISAAAQPEHVLGVGYFLNF